MNTWHYRTARDLGLTAASRHQSLTRECGLLDSLVRLAWASAIRTLLATWNSLEIHGRERLPKHGPFVLIANHTSHLDALALAAALPLRWLDRIHPIVAGDYFFQKRSLAAFAATALNALPIWRRQKTGCARALLGLRARLSAEEAIYIVFPEGARSRDGIMHPFKPGLGLLVAETDVPVLPCYLSGAFAAMPPHRAFPRRSMVSLEIGQPMTFESIPNEREGWSRIAAMTETAVRQLARNAPTDARQHPPTPSHLPFFLGC